MLFNLLFELGWKLITIAFFLALGCLVLSILVQAFIWMYDVHVLLGLVVSLLVVGAGARILYIAFKT